MESRDLQYADEIRGWLLGRLSINRTKGAVAHGLASERQPRILSWWIFEGRSYPGLEGSLAQNWDRIDREARALLGVYSPAWRSANAVEGEVDWVATAQARMSSHRTVFITRASRAGLSEAERGALTGWRGWVAALWADWVDEMGPPRGCSATLPWDSNADWGWPDERSLKRWAHIARRSRWPLLRNVVAGSLRSSVEVEDLDALPLPADHPSLFELLCIVRILQQLSGESNQIRWLDLEDGRNRIQVPGITCHYQKVIDSDLLLGTHEFQGGLRAAVKRHGVSLPREIDALLAFESPIAGFDGILIEAKSGTQTYRDALFQLKCYRAALAAERAGRFIVWGLVEQPQADPTDWAKGSAFPTAPDEDLWVFSTAGDIPAVLQAAGLAFASDIRLAR